mmetsp:Transcript_100939/g.254345  ORF Transcript_100939/g.254345 Transcript_100939/m.254345 type:complete len:564 (+) Transcript_100939:10-1701(+)
MPDWLWPSYWYSSIAESVQYLVKRRTLLLYLFWQLLIEAVFFALFFFYPGIAVLGWQIKGPLLFAVIACWRASMTLFGMFALCRRNVDWMRYFFVMFMLDCLLQILATQPLWNVGCSLDTYAQTSALVSFEPKLIQFHHPQTEQEWLTCTSGCIPWHQPPPKSKEEPLTEEDLEKYKGQIETAQIAQTSNKTQKPNSSLVELEMVSGILTERSAQGFLALPQKLESKTNSQGGLSSHLIREPKSIYELEVDNTQDWRSATEKMMALLENECICDRGESGKESCNTYKEDAKAHRKFWCYVNPAKVPVCVLSHKVNIFTSMGESGERVFWTEDLCDSKCRCSGLGQYPHHSTDLDLEAREDTLWSNLMNYGETCQMWAQTDRKANTKWCYVGFDTTCPDRYLRTSGDDFKTHVDDLNHKGEKDHEMVQDVIMQFKSSVAVDDKGGGKYCGNFGPADADLARKRCLSITLPAALAALLDLMLRLPILLLLWLFLSNHCMDQLPVEEHYNIAWSSDEEDDVHAGPSVKFADKEDVCSFSSGASETKSVEPTPTWRDRFTVFGKKRD